MGIRMQERVTATPSKGPAGRPSVVRWAGLGAVFVAVQLYLYGRWIASGNTTPTKVGPVPLPSYMTVANVLHYILGGIALAVAFWFLLIRPWRRAGHITTEGLFLLAFVTCFWQDLAANYFHYWVIYNPGWLNLGSWYNFIPGWHGGLANLQPEPITFFLPMYPTVGFGFVFVASRILRALESRRGRPLRGPALFLLAFALLGGADFVLEVAWVRLGLYVYPSTIKSLTLFPGHMYQFPVYESICWGLSWAGICFAYYRRNDRGETLAETGASTLTSPARSRTLIRFLAIAAVCNLGYLAYNVETAVISRQGGPWPAEFTKRPYLTYLCSEKDPYACPPGVDPAVGTGTQK
ncbi:MAG TPA: spirocyclase AveC family protein [Acidimicrobiia bacterium]|nr:spirocyclase AveC family protein [Acidimicrobiia bacterium]